MGRSASGSGSVLDWLQSPSSDTGFYFAGAGELWDYVSYESLARRASAAAHRLTSSGIRNGSRLGLIDNLTPGFMAGFFGAMLAGIQPVAIAPPSALRRLDTYRTYLEGVSHRVALSGIATSSELSSTVKALAPYRIPVLVEDGDEASVSDFDPVISEQLLYVQLTSGTTTTVKAVGIGRSSLEHNIRAIHKWLRMDGSSVWASWLPPFHDMGLVGSIISPASIGINTWVMRPDQFIRTPLRWLSCFGRGDATLTGTTGFGIRYVLRRIRQEMLEGFDFRGWRAVVIGAERVSADDCRQLEELLGEYGFSTHAICPAYGLAEATLAVSGHRPGERRSQWPASQHEPGQGIPTPNAAIASAGAPLDDLTVWVEVERGKKASDRDIGEVCVSGSSLALGYVDGERLESFGGVVRTGDLGMQVEGNLFVLGRMGDALKVRGSWLFAEDVEDAVRDRLPNSVRYCAVLGVVGGVERVILIVEKSGDRASTFESAISAVQAITETEVHLLWVAKGWILYTTSGKLRRREMWSRIVEERLLDAGPA